jgi:enamine deaminase RidA (YjgF/YER057c/UK114 family)
MRAQWPETAAFRTPNVCFVMLKFRLVTVSFRKIVCFALLLLLAVELPAQKRKNKKDEEPPTQVLPPLPDPPDAVVAETAKLSFQISPLSPKGLLSQQVKDALKAIQRDNHGATIVKIRAFVAGSGDLRRVQAIVSEEFTDQKRSLPTVSTIQVGALPMVGAQVILEATSVEKKAVNPNGVAFISATNAKDSMSAMEALKKRATGVDVQRITCLLSDLNDQNTVRGALASAFPSALTNFAQTQRQSIEPLVACEGVGRIQAARNQAISQEVAYITTPKIVLTGTKLVFRDQDADVRLAFQRLSKALEPLGASMKDVFWTGVFALTRPMNAKVAEVRGEFLDSSKATAGQSIVVEGLPSTDATAAIEVIATAR